MKSNSQSDPSHAVWPFDLRVFAVVAGLWSLCLAISALIPVPIADVELVDPIETIFAGVRFAGYDARVVLMVEAGIFAAIAVGILLHRRWGLLLALCYMVEVVMSHLAFVIAYLPVRSGSCQMPRWPGRTSEPNLKSAPDVSSVARPT